MKSFKTIIASLVLALSLAGCNEDSFLEEQPHSSLYPENLLVNCM